MKILFIGDIVGKPGRKAVQRLLPAIRAEHGVDFVIGNAENLAHGKGITPDTLADITNAGVDFCTSGNHIWSKPQGADILNETPPRVLRPANYPENNSGIGIASVSVGDAKLLIINLIGTVFMYDAVDNPFLALDSILSTHNAHEYAGIIVDFHAETTSEKNTFGYYADGRVSAVVGTHTHVPTADERILPGGTGYITDIGMVGLKHSSIGINFESVINTFLTGAPARKDIAENGTVVFNSVLIEIDPETRRCASISRIQKDIDI